MRYTVIIGFIGVLCMLAGGSAAAQPSGTPDQQPAAVGQTPPRLSFVDGQVSFWRPGAQDWTQAQLNTPLAPGERALYRLPRRSGTADWLARFRACVGEHPDRTGES